MSAYRLTLGSVRDVAAKAANLCSTDSRVPDYVNRACERLLYMGKWPGTYARYRICVNNSCLVWPREVETIESFAICSLPGTVFSEWYEFLGDGPGLVNDNTCNSNSLIKQGDTCVFDWVTGEDKKLAIYSDVAESADGYVILRFYDENGNWVRTLDTDGTWIDGEKLALPAAGAYAYTTNECNQAGPVAVIKTATNGTIRLYEYDTVALTYKPLAYYEPDETIPVYSYSKVPGLTNTGDCSSTSVTVIAKRRFIPVDDDNDFIQIPHKEAVRLAVTAIRKEEDDKLDEAMGYWALALQCLQDQLRHYRGAGEIIPMRLVGAETFGGAITHIQ